MRSMKSVSETAPKSKIQAKMPLENVKEPTKMPMSKSYITSEPPTMMMSPYAKGPVDRTDDESPLELDAAKN